MNSIEIEIPIAAKYKDKPFEACKMAVKMFDDFDKKIALFFLFLMAESEGVFCIKLSTFSKEIGVKKEVLEEVIDYLSRNGLAKKKDLSM